MRKNDGKMMEKLAKMDKNGYKLSTVAMCWDRRLRVRDMRRFAPPKSQKQHCLETMTENISK